MKSINNIIKATLIASATFCCTSVLAGNEDRIGTAGASEILINPWARTSALGDAGVASSTGLEATFSNIAGLAFTDKTQLKFNRTSWLGQAGITLNSAGFAQKIGESSVFAISVQAMNFGEIQGTSVELPEGNGFVFSPRVSVFNIGYARTFSSSIYGGINVKVISQSISNLKASGIAFDAGIRYVTGENDHIKFGIALKNVGPTMRFKGDGLAQDISYLSLGTIATLEQRSAEFELPSLLNIGGSYDFLLNEKSKFTVNGAFTANSFQNDQYRIGLDYGMTLDKAAFNLRFGYVGEKGIFSKENRSNALIGPAAGFSVDALVGKNKTALSLEYSARMAGIFGFIHTVGVMFDIK